ncbi:hypothetical protein [Pediococcus pentosaceus]|uniref:hypothetical protein n=1 Tax=Pediococcus pentosaceus TaxID=1255 RepID=UPI0011097932|nr:hypothetical protein [Pediococcus pentosaceus]MBF7130897.1 hypothetical protein [Pediococcus pentosaceus]TLQ02275.1 hypothetical protein FEZ50_05380 [Pediococcus pentosaceus]
MSTKILQLKSRNDDSEMGLSKDENYYPKTSSDAVAGLDKFIAKQVVTYQPATETNDGLMTAADKNKLNKIKAEPLEGLEFKSPDGSVFVLSVDNEGKAIFTKEENNAR